MVMYATNLTWSILAFAVVAHIEKSWKQLSMFCMNKKKIDWHFAAGISVRLTALDVMTNQPISPAPSIYVQLNSTSQAPLTSPGVIPNVTLGTQVFALSFDNTRVIGHIVAYAKDISNDGIMDVTLMLSPQMVQRFPLLQTFPFHICRSKCLVKLRTGHA
jgi:hypothetical protein